jgi:copper chaperone NosL
MKYKQILLIALILVLSACSSKPVAIEYGVDGCHFCKMTIVDKLHAAEVVTQKGKVYKFDATECMINFMDGFDISTIKLYLSNNYTEPEALIDATTATFLISKKVPSPMGAFLSAFKIKEDAIDVQAAKGGTIYTWEELLNHYKD